LPVSDQDTLTRKKKLSIICAFFLDALMAEKDEMDDYALWRIAINWLK
jgi:hypothetical protein